MTAAEGDGPVNALDFAIRKALLRFYPGLKDISLVNYKVRVLEENRGTAPKCGFSSRAPTENPSGAP